MSQNYEEQKVPKQAKNAYKKSLQARGKMLTRSMIRNQMTSLSSMAISSEDGELDVMDPFRIEFRLPARQKIAEKCVQTLNFNQISHEKIFASIDRFFAEEEYQSIMLKELRLKENEETDNTMQLMINEGTENTMQSKVDSSQTLTEIWSDIDECQLNRFPSKQRKVFLSQSCSKEIRTQASLKECEVNSSSLDELEDVYLEKLSKKFSQLEVDSRKLN